MDKYTTVVKHANSLTVDEYNLALDLGAKNNRTETVFNVPVSARY